MSKQRIDRKDWTTVEGCPRCNKYGPFLPSGMFYTPERDRDLHVAWHTLVAEILRPIARLSDWLNRRLTR